MCKSVLLFLKGLLPPFFLENTRKYNWSKYVCTNKHHSETIWQESAHTAVFLHTSSQINDGSISLSHKYLLSTNNKGWKSDERWARDILYDRRVSGCQGDYLWFSKLINQEAAGWRGTAVSHRVLDSESPSSTLTFNRLAVL